MLNGQLKMGKIMEIKELKALIKESMREVLREERLLLCKILIPYVDNTEQTELETEFGSPADYSEDEVVDMTAWVRHGTQVS
jgi:hypothetical protein